MGEARRGALLSARGLVKQYGAADSAAEALSRVYIDVAAGEEHPSPRVGGLKAGLPTERASTAPWAT